MPDTDGIIIEATLVASSASKFGEGSISGKTIQDAMLRAARFAHSKGITDPEKVRAMMMEARQMVMDQAKAAFEKIKADREADLKKQK